MVLGLINAGILFAALAAAGILGFAARNAPIALVVVGVVSVLAARWALAVLDDEPLAIRTGAALVVRGGMAGAPVGAAAAVALTFPGLGAALFAAMLGAFYGVGFGVLCALLDVALLARVPPLRPTPPAPAA